MRRTEVVVSSELVHNKVVGTYTRCLLTRKWFDVDERGYEHLPPRYEQPRVRSERRNFGLLLLFRFHFNPSTPLPRTRFVLAQARLEMTPKH